MTSDKTDAVIGELEVTVTFRIRVHDLSHYDATDLKMAAENMDTWYHDGSADLAADMVDESPEIQVRVVEDTY